MNDDRALLDIAAAIADGAPVDWAAFETPGAASAQDDAAAMAARLRALERLVQGHDALRSDAVGCASAQETGPVATLLTEAREAADPASGPLEVRWGPLLVIEKIGSGSFGDVYRARDPKVDREVALKLVPEAGRSASIAVDEARRLARVAHPNVLAVYGAERIDGRVGIWTQFVRGGTLEDEIRERGPLQAEEAARIGIEVARALGAVHAAGLLHRDVKAHNVMRDASGRIVLTDFGTSVEFDEETGVADPRLAGTPLYLAPEVLEGRPASVASDLYSLGVLLYHLVTSDYPVLGSTAREIRESHRAGRRRTLAAETSGLPAAFVAAVDRLLAPDPGSRFADAASVEAALAGRLAEHRRAVWPWAAAIAGVALVAAGLTAWLRDGFGPVADPGWTSREIADAPCSSRPRPGDGHMVCFSAAGLVSWNPSTGQNTTLKPADPERRPTGSALSPDGRSMAYMLGPVLRQPSNPERSLWIHDIESGSDRKVTDLPGDALLVALRSWHETGPLEFYMRRANQTYALAHVSPDSGALWTAFEFPSMPQGHATSPDGRLIAFDFRASDREARDIQVCAIASGACTVVSKHPADDFFPFWTPDGRLIFTTSRDRGYSLYQTRLDGPRELQQAALVAELGHTLAFPVGFSETGEFYYQRRSGWPDVYDVPLPEPGRPAQATVRLSSGAVGQAKSAVWSPDGRSVAYVQQRGPFAETGATAVVVRPLEGGDERVFPMDVRFNSAGLSWSPDGRRIALRAILGDVVLDQRLGIHIVDATSGDLVRSWHVDVDTVVAGVAWIDDSTVVFRQGSAVRLFDVDTGSARTLTDIPTCWGNSALRLSFDRQTLALNVVREGECRIALIAVSNGAVRDLEWRAERFQLHDWMPDGQRLLVSLPDATTGEPGSTQLWYVPVNGSAASPVRLAPSNGVDAVRVHPDGTRLAVGMGRPSMTLWVATGLPR